MSRATLPVRRGFSWDPERATLPARFWRLGVEPEKVTDEASFVEDLGADSLDTVELVMAFEEEFGIDIPDEDAEQMRTVGDAIKYLKDNIPES